MKSMIFLVLALALNRAEAGPSCDFENDLCGWQQSGSDEFDWTRKSGPTYSPDTGPSSGHGGSGYYMYIETSYPRSSDDKAILTFQGANSGTVCLSFYYHMYGLNINRLNVYNSGNVIFTKSGNQGNTWKKAAVSISGNYDLKIEAIRGNSFRGDIAIDDISVSRGSCGPSCDFENDLCGWQQSGSDEFDWTRKSGPTSSSYTGPSGGHGGSGYYMYIETSFPRSLGDKAILTFQGANSGTVCLSFYYHMYGLNINRLNVYNSGNVIFTKSGNQGNAWKNAAVSISGNYDLKIEAIRGNSFRGDIAIDDISVSRGSCDSCGISPMTRVIGGDEASPGHWPWQVALLTTNQTRFFCGGSLIAPDWIVTAAHCISSLRGSYYTIRVGEHNWYVNEGTEEDILGKRVIKHPSYNSPSALNNDIALIQLERPVKLNPRVGTVCLPSQNENVPTSARCYITGWGKVTHPGSAHHTLQQARLPPVSKTVCAKKLATSPGGSFLKITDQMICAGRSGNILSGCHGDSGGPYVCQSSGGNWVLQGAVSWGSTTCSAAERYTVFARVAKFRNWINQYV